MFKKQIIRQKISILLAIVVSVLLIVLTASVVQAQTSESGPVGIEGKISAPPPTVGASITFPSNGQVITQLPITVTGICPKDLLVRLYKNNVFSGSAYCTTGSYSIITDLYTGANELVAKVYDSLDQPGPDSNKVNVTFNDPAGSIGTRVSLTSNYAKRGANPGETLEWPIILSGGNGPYAVKMDWGDGKTADLISLEFPGTFTTKHVYDSPGVYNIVVQATDKNGGTAFLQLVGIGNGPLTEGAGITTAGKNTTSVVGKTRILWEPAAFMIPLIAVTFWLGQRFELRTIKKRIESGGRPFKK
jgi:hypothetical protein